MTNDSESNVSAPARGPRPFVKKHKTALIAVAVVLLFLAIAVRIGQRRPSVVANGPSDARGGPNGPVAVSVATVTPGDIQIRIPALGTVTTLANVTVRTQISGTLQKILFTEGQLVHEGDVIAQIDPRPYEAALQTMQGNLRRDQALLADARLDLKRYEGLVKEDSIAAQQLDTQRALVDQYTGTIESDEGQVKTAQVNLLYTRIVSPVTGIVGIRQVDQGNYVTPGDANGIVVINQVQPISVLFSIPEDNVSSLMKKLRSGATMKVEAYDRTNSVKLAEGKLLTADNIIDTTTGTVKLRALFDNAGGTLFPNQFVNIYLLQDLLQNQLIMPNAAVRRGAPNGVVTTFVYLVNSDRTVTVRPVTLGTVDGERVAVLAGLKAGDVVVTEGGDRLRDGALVLLPAATAGARSAAQTPAEQTPAEQTPATQPLATQPLAAQPTEPKPPGARQRSHPDVTKEPGSHQRHFDAALQSLETARSDADSDRLAKLAQARAQQDKAAQDKAAQDKAAQDKAAQDKAARDKAARDKAARDNAAQDKAAQDKAARDKAAQDKAAQDKAAQDKAAQDKAAQDKAAQDKAAQDKAAQESRLAAQRIQEVQSKARQQHVVDLFHERMSQGRLTDPENDSAAYYLNSLKASDPQAPDLATMSRALQDGIAARAGAPQAAKTTPGPASGAASGSAPDPAPDATLKLLTPVNPTYPRWARRSGAQGWVDVAFTVGPDGRVTNLHVADASSPGLFDHAALEAMQSVRYQAIPRDQPQVTRNTKLRINFKLE